MHFFFQISLKPVRRFHNASGFSCIIKPLQLIIKLIVYIYELGLDPPDSTALALSN